MGMATTRKSRPKASADAAGIRSAYQEYVLTEGKAPASVFKFCKHIGIPEKDFYQHYGSFESIDRAIWAGYAQTVQSHLESDSNFAALSAREKILTYYFALAEVLASERSYVVYRLKSCQLPTMPPAFLKDFRSAFESWISAVLNEGKQAGDVATRPYLDNRYHHLFWLHLMFILQFWIHDDSAHFEHTDAAIEKSVNLAFDLVGKGVLDNAIDLGKFLYQHARN